MQEGSSLLYTLVVRLFFCKEATGVNPANETHSQGDACKGTMFWCVGLKLWVRCSWAANH